VTLNDVERRNDRRRALFLRQLSLLNSARDCNAECVLAGSVNAVYDLLNSSDTAPAGNLQSSYTTIASFPGLMFGIINIIG